MANRIIKPKSNNNFPHGDIDSKKAVLCISEKLVDKINIFAVDFINQFVFEIMT